jgi:hypothetical protein
VRPYLAATIRYSFYWWGGRVSTWSQEKALERARTAYSYVARFLPPDADLEAIGKADRRVLEAEQDRNMDVYVEALRTLCIEAKRAAMDRGKAA